MYEHDQRLLDEGATPLTDNAQKIQRLQAELDAMENVPRSLRRELRLLQVELDRLVIAGELLATSLATREQVLDLLGSDAEDPKMEAQGLLELNRIYTAPGKAALARLEMERELLNDEHYAWMYDSEALPQDHETAYSAYAQKHGDRPLMERFTSVRAHS